MTRPVRLLLFVVLLVFAAIDAVLPAFAAPPPTLTSVNPAYAINTTYTVLMIWGSGFSGVPGSYHASNPSITLHKDGQTDITVAGQNVYVYPAGDEIGTNVFPITGAALGTWDVIVTNSDGQSATLPGAFTILGPYATPTVTGISPNTAPNSGPVTVTITGTNFFVPPSPGGPTMTAQLTHGTPYGAIDASSVNVLSANEMTCTFDLTGKGWGASSPWNVVVKMPNSGPTGTLNNVFSATAPAPTVTSITPAYGAKTAGVSVTINGTDFMGTSGYSAGNPQVTLRKAGETDIILARGSVYLTNSGRISGTLPITNAPLGVWDVIITNYDGQSATLPAAFTVYATAKPTVTAITPNSGTSGSTVSITNLAGTGFLAGSTVKLQAAGQPDIAASSVVVVSATKITCSFDLTGAVAGLRDVTVTIPDGQSGTKAGAFTVYNPAPVVSSITPNSGRNNEGTTATITGSGFLPGAAVKLKKTGQTDIVATNVNVSSPTEITCTFAPALGSTGVAGAWDVVVTNPSGLPGTLAAAFTITFPAPTVTSITPPYAVNTGLAALQVWGTGFLGVASSYNAANPSLTLRKAGSADITVPGSSIYLYPSGNQIGINNFPLTGAALGTWDVIVTNNDGQSATLPAAFTVLPAYSTPTVTAITPDTAANSGSVNVTITGTNFFVPPAPGGPVMGVSLTHGTPYGSLAATNVVASSPTELTCTFNLTGIGWGSGSPWNVIVQAPSSGPSATLNNAFTVTASAPTVTAITPAYGAKTSGASVSIDGTNFLGTVGYNVGNPQVTLRKAGETDIVLVRGQVYLNSASKITGTLPITNAPLGVWDVIVTNYDGQSTTLPGAFTIYATARPTVTAVTPVSAMNTGSVSVTNLAGTGFLAGSTVKLTAAGKPDIVATNVTVVSATKITCDFDLTGAAVGARNVTVTIPDGQFGTKANAFTVNGVAPTVTAVTPNTGTNAESVSITDLSGTGFRPGATVVLKKTGEPDLTVTGVNVVSPTRITGDVNLNGAAVGLWDVVVTNPDTLSATLAGGFTVTNAPPTVVSATYVDSTHVDLVFNKAMDATTAEVAANYLVSPALSVSSAVLDADTVTVHLVTGTQAENTTYTATVTGVADLLGTTIANVNNSAQWTSADLPPTVISATYVDNTHVDLVFNKALDQATAEIAGNYVISPALAVSGAALDADGLTVHLTTGTQIESTTYTATVTGVKDALGTAIANVDNTGRWTAPAVPPTLTSATYVDGTHVDLLFSEALDAASAEVASNYSISPALAVSGAVLDADTVTVHLTTAAQSESTTYTVTVTGVTDAAGTAIASPNNTAQWISAHWPPTLTSATYVDGTHVDLLFNKALDATTAQVAANYAVSPTLAVSGAVLDADTMTVHLTTDTQASTTAYTVTVTGVKDALGTVIANTGNTAQWTSGNVASVTLPNVILNQPQGSSAGPSWPIIRVGFDKPMNKSLTQTAFSLTVDGSSTPVTGSFVWAGDEMKYYVQGALAPLTTYRATVAATAETATGVAMAAPFTWTFTTNNVPALNSWSPKPAATLNTVVRVSFNQPMDAAATQGAFSLKIAGTSTPVAGSFGWSGNELVFAPSATLTADTTYRASLTTAAKSSAGIALGAPFSWDFKTNHGPTVVLNQPQGSNAGPSWPVIRVGFDQAMNGALTQAAFSLTPNGTTTPVLGIFGWSGNEMRYYVQGALAPLTTYRVTVAATAQSATGVAMGTPYSWTFTTNNVPAINSWTPKTAVPLNSAIRLGFNQAMNQALTQGAFSLKVAGSSTPLPGSFSWSGTELVFTPSALLAPDTTYRASVTTAAQSAGGVALGAPFSWDFKTNLGPTVCLNQPQGSSTGGSWPVIRVGFDQPMNATLTQAAFSLTQDGTNTAVPGYFGWANNELKYYVQGALAPLTTYRVTVAATAQAATGVALGTPFTWTFTTNNVPAIASWTPKGTVPANTVVKLTFNQPMNAALTEGAFSLKTVATSTAVAGAFSWSGNELSFTPSAPLVADTAYRASITTAAQSSAGVALGAAFSWDFKTAPAGTGTAMVTAVASETRQGAQLLVTLGSKANVTATIRNMAGRPITVLQPGLLSAGAHTLLWNGKSANGVKVPAGTYPVEVTANAADGGKTNALAALRLQR